MTSVIYREKPLKTNMFLINAVNHSQGCIVQSRRKLTGNGKNSAAHLISSTLLL